MPDPFPLIRRGREPAIVTVSILFWVSLDLALVPAPSHPWPGDGRLGVAPAVAGNLGDITPAACGQCHREIYRSWLDSSHARATTAGLFPQAFPAEPFRACLRCHAPEDPAGLAPEAGAVTCATCHVKDGTVLTAHDPPPPAPHPLRHSPAITRDRCLQCHEWAYPLLPRQSHLTGTEMLGGEHAARDCASCHIRPGGFDHSFPGARAGELIRDAVPVDGRLEAGPGGPRLVIHLGPVVSGHRVPTGDPLRTLDIEWQCLDADGDLVDAGSWSLGRRFVSHLEDDGRRKVTVVDDRLIDGEIRRLEAKPKTIPSGGRFRVRVMLVLVPRSLRELPGFPRIPDRTVFHDELIPVGDGSGVGGL